MTRVATIIENSEAAYPHGAKDDAWVWAYKKDGV